MAIFNEILSARYARMIQKLFSMKGPPPVKQLAGEIMPIIPFFNGVENRYLEGWERFGTVVALTAAAGQFPGFRLRNGTNAVAAVIESLFIATGSTAGEVAIQVASVALDLTTGVVSGRDDPRGRPVSAMILSSQLTLVANIAPIQYRLQTAPGPSGAGTASLQVISNENQELTVLPGDALTVGGMLAAGTLVVSCNWRERVLEESERA